MIKFNKEMMQNFVENGSVTDIQRFFNYKQNIQLIEKDDYNELYFLGIMGQPVPMNQEYITAVLLLSNIDVLDFLEGIPKHCFDSLPIESVEIPNNILLISAYAFDNCMELEELTIPSSVKVIEQFAFYDCESLTEITYKGTSAQWENIVKDSKWINGDRLDKIQIHCTDKTIEI